MTVSSENIVDPFERVRLSHVRALMDVLESTAIRDEVHVRRRFLETSHNYDETVGLLVDIGFVARNGEGILRLPLRVANDNLVNAILQRLSASRGVYRNALRTYLSGYTVYEGVPTMRPVPATRGNYSHLRNFLIECGVVTHDNESDCYVVAQEHSILYVELSAKNPVTPDLITHSVQRDLELGLRVEHAVLAYEKLRVGDEWARCVRHIAPINAAAGYDIESVSLTSDRAEPRFIEVKAVSEGDLAFYWTSNEVGTARKLRTWYYLYLVPIDRQGQLKTDAISIFADPIITLLDDHERWSVEPSEFKCSRRGPLLR